MEEQIEMEQKNKGFTFSDDFKARVKLNHGRAENDIYATLEIRKNKLPLLTLDSSSELKNWLPFVNADKHEIKCKSEIKDYTLLDCDLAGEYVYPRFIIEGNVDHVNGVEVSLSGFSAWFDQDTHFQITDSKITKDIPSKRFNEKVFIDGSEYEISSNYCCTIRNLKKKDFLVSEYTTVKIVRLNGDISIYEAEELAHDIRKIFSLLLALPLSIEHAWILEKDNGIRKPFYFIYTGSNSEPFEYAIESLVGPAELFKNNMWCRIFESYYSSPTKEQFKDIWSRLTALYSYRGIWEYQFLGYVSVLDAYSGRYVEKKREKLGTDDYASITKELLAVIDRYRVNIDGAYFNVLDSFKNGVESIKNTDMPTFKEKFNCVLSSMGEDIKDVINFTQDEFSVIKKIRDLAAHGQPFEPKNGRDVTFESRIKDKLLVLLMYLVYRDFGFSSVDFARALKSTFSEFVRNAEINSMKRDKLTGLVPFYEVNRDNFQEASKTRKFYIGLMYFKSKNIYRYSASVTDEIQNNWISNINKVHRNLVDHIKEKIPSLGVLNIEFISQAYLVCGDDRLNISGICLVTYE